MTQKLSSAFLCCQAFKKTIWRLNFEQVNNCGKKSAAGFEEFMLEEIVTTTKIYKLGTTNLNFTLCLNKELDTPSHR